MLNVCRICLIVVDETNCLSVFLKIFHNKSVLEIMKECSSIQVFDEEDLPKHVCPDCVEKLDYLYNFRKLIINSDLQLRKQLRTETEQLECLAHQVTIEKEQNFTDKSCSVSKEEINLKEGKSNKLIVDKNCNEHFLEESETNLKCPESVRNVTNVKEHRTEGKPLKKRGRPKKLEGLIKSKRKYECLECNKIFKSAYSARKHKINHTGIVPYSCELCKKGFCRKWALTIHTRVHTGDKPFSCNICQKKFGSPSSLVNHKKIHSGVKKFNCNICNTGFYHHVQFEVHMRRHTGEKPYMCEICSKTFGDKSNLIRHKGRHQGRLIPCPICGKTYKGQEGLQAHIKRHNGLKPFSCNECGQKFTEQNSLTRHKLIHSGIKPYKCKVCEKSFSQGGILIRHLRIHSGEKPFPCTLCPKEFAYKHHLQGHMKSHHKDFTSTLNSNKRVHSQVTKNGTNLEKSTSVT